MTTRADSPEPELNLPLDGITVLDFSQFMAGPVAAMRLGDLGARVIKIERPEVGDLGRSLAFAGIELGQASLSFHIMNRNKQSLAADLKRPEDLGLVKELIGKADVLIQNFRPGVMERIGLDFEAVRAINPRLVYASVTGYGATGPWSKRPGQDLLAQAISGLPWLNGSKGGPPVPVGLAIADMFASCHIAQGVTALLVRRSRTGLGGLIETSLLEGMLDLQMELLAAYAFDRTKTVSRPDLYGAHAYLGSPYGLFPTQDGYLAIAMTPVPRLGQLLGIPLLIDCTEAERWMDERDELNLAIGARLATMGTAHWLELLDAHDIWCAPVLTLEELVASEGFESVAMMHPVQQMIRGQQAPDTLLATRSPIRVDGHQLTPAAGSPILGSDTQSIRDELLRARLDGG